MMPTYRFSIAVLVFSLILVGCSKEDGGTASDDSLKPPTNLTAARTGLTRVQLNWTDNNTTEDGYTIERRANAGSFRAVLYAARNVNSVTDSIGLYVDTLYQYRARATTITNYSAYSETLNVRFTLPYPSVR